MFILKNTYAHSIALTLIILFCSACQFTAQASDVPQSVKDEPVNFVKEQLTSKNYTAQWGTPNAFPGNAILELGSGNGHGGTLRWIRFLPGKDDVEILWIEFNEGREQYKSKWPPDKVPIEVLIAHMKPEAYNSLMRDLADIDATTLTKTERADNGISSNNFWVQTRLISNAKTLLDWNHAGYTSGSSEIEYAKPSAAVIIAKRASEKLEFKQHELTADEHAWASKKFLRDWKMMGSFQKTDSYWWVRERYLAMIGIVGDKKALPVLRDVLAAEPSKPDTQPDELMPLINPRDSGEGRCVYTAINAVTRLTKRDLRDKPVEDMDIEKMRLKVLELLKDEK